MATVAETTQDCGLRFTRRVESAARPAQLELKGISPASALFTYQRRGLANVENNPFPYFGFLFPVREIKCSLFAFAEISIEIVGSTLQ